MFGHSGDQEVWENMDEGTITKTKEMLDDMHKRKIDMADGILLLMLVVTLEVVQGQRLNMQKRIIRKYSI